jgi:hypothetical protein
MSKLHPYNGRRLHKSSHLSFGSPQEIAEILELYGPQLENFRIQLFDLYNKKAELISKRESVRFRYLTNWFTRVKYLTSKFSDSLYALGDDSLITTGELGLKTLFNYSSFPMVSLDDSFTKINTFGSAIQLSPGLYYSSNRPGKIITLLGTYDLLFENPYNPSSTDKSPFSLVNRDGLLSLTVSQVVSQNFMPIIDLGYTKLNYKNADFFFEIMNHNSPGSSESTLEKANIVKDLYYSLGFVELFDEGKSLFTEIVKLTLDLTKISYSIYDAEEEVKNFISSYKALDAQEVSTLLSDILTELQNISQLQTVQTMQATSLPQAADPVLEITNTIPSPISITEKTSSKKGLMLTAAAALGVFLITKE